MGDVRAQKKGGFAGGGGRYLHAGPDIILKST